MDATKTCSFCAEQIPVIAVRCPFCRSDLPPEPVPATTSPVPVPLPVALPRPAPARTPPVSLPVAPPTTSPPAMRQPQPPGARAVAAPPMVPPPKPPSLPPPRGGVPPGAIPAEPSREIHSAPISAPPTPVAAGVRMNRLWISRKIVIVAACGGLIVALLLVLLLRPDRTPARIELAGLPQVILDYAEVRVEARVLE